MTNLNRPLTTIGLSLLIMGQLLPQIDFSIVNVALKLMGKTLQTQETGLVLIVACYALCFSTLIATGARLGDQYGRKRIFLCGVLGFGMASIICGASPTLYIMLLGRLLQGLFAALLMPQILSTIHASLSGERHSRAVSIFTSITGLSVAFGQIFGGWIVSANFFNLSWRAAFFVNVPLCLIIFIAGALFIPETQSTTKPTMDLKGIFLFAGVMLCLLIPIAIGHQWPNLYWLLLAVIPFSVSLIRTELTQEKNGGSPLFPPSIFKRPSARIGLIAEVAVTTAYSGYAFVTAICLQKALNFTPLQSGNTFMGLGLMFFIGSLLSKPASKRWGNARTFVFGSIFSSLGFISTIILFWVIGQKLTVSWLLLGTGLVGFGNAFMLTSAFKITLSHIDKLHASEASSALITVQQGFFALGTALAGTIYSTLSHYSYLVAITSAIGTMIGIVAIIGCILFIFSRDS